MINKEIKSESAMIPILAVNTVPNGMVVMLNQEGCTITLSIDQAATLAVEILTHVDAMAKLHLGNKAEQFIHKRNNNLTIT